MEKRGSITDLTYIMTGIFTVALISILVSLLVSNLNSEFQEVDVIDSRAKSASTLMSDDVPNVMNVGIIVIFFAMCIISFVLASLVPVHPVFLIFYILELVLVIWLGGGIANAYQTVIENPVFAVQAAQFEIATLFFRYFPFIVAIVGTILSIVMYKAKRSIIGYG